MKTIVTHFNPDVDAICSVWLIKRQLPEFKDAEVKFVPAGKTLNDQKADSNPDIIHVDTGFGQFDHHHTNKRTCASKLVYEFLDKKGFLKKGERKILERMVELVTAIDHFENAFWPDPSSDRYLLFVDSIIDGFKLNFPKDDLKIIDLGFLLLDSVYTQIGNKVWAEKLIKEEGIEFSSPWGKGIGISTTNDEAVSLAQKSGYKIVVRKDPHKDYVRIKSLPVAEINLTQVYNKLMELDKDASWFLHAGKHMILNGSTKNPEMKPTKLTLEEIIEVIKNL